MSLQTGYAFVRLYHKYKDEINSFDNDSNGIYELRCTNITDAYVNTNNSCIKAMKYLNYLESRGHNDYSANGCKYLSYWIYYYVFNKQQVSKSFEFYEKLLDEYESFGNFHFCKNYIKEINKLPYEILEKLIDLYQKFYSGNTQGKKCDCKCAKECATLYNNYRSICLEPNDDYFCNELEIFKNKYDENMLIISTCTDAPRILQSVKTFDTSVIIISISLIVLISFISFIFYKFTPLGSWMHPLIKRKKKMYNNSHHKTQELIYDERNNTGSYEKAYHMTYQSSG
ncbi:PIR protein [Plasmodium vivax]|uniref:VIR protein n=1 Tax=Plasmodium vivax TaxID=5855 RepID=A0A565A5M0_PLAVI|nr:PIR protein [Plasmodium vivax]